MTTHDNATPEFIAVRSDAIDWLQKHYPALCEKSGLCERIAGRLYTRTAARQLQPAASLREQEDAPSEKQRKLLELANRIDHEELWRWAGMDHHKMTPEQKDRMNAGVALRRYANLWAPGRWIVFPPVGPVHFSASTLEKAVEMAKKDAQRLGREKE